MLLHTFQHIRGIGSKKELDLWRSGITSWEDLKSIQDNQLKLFKNLEDNSINLSMEALHREDTDFFARRLPKHEYYRIALAFPEKILFLDIETTGLSKYYDTITLVGWSLGKEYGAWIKGDNDKALRKAMSRAKAIVTFNGSIFDLPFLRKEFKGLAIPSCHIDLRFFVRRVGLSGGQKKIECLLGLKRPKNIADIKGETAALLWYRYRWGDPSALKQLIQYNHADVEGMKVILDKVIARLLEKQPFPFPTPPAHHFSKYRSKIRWFNVNSTSRSGIKIRPYRGKSGPAITLKHLTTMFDKDSLRIVGIDLTGSEERPSGWCLLHGDYATTKRINTDEDLIQETINARPTLISIDSPLSLPLGRVSVADNDPGRDLYGIMRRCERTLKKRGINVYPSLIPSMQKLTARGIKLAHHFRSLGLPVIESYPGAAQDIMGIPRKGLSQEFLALGLKKFGIKGRYIKNPVTHDELDAITSAVVGLFFWSGRFEPLGNEEEDYLIIPDIQIDPTQWMTRRVIGFSGPIYAGKTTAARYLESKGFSYGRYSFVLKKMLLDRGLPPSRQNLQKIGQEVCKCGQRELSKKLIKTLPDQGDLVIDGLRHPEDHAFLVETFGPAFLHIYIDAPEEIRLDRYLANGYNKRDFRDAVTHSVEANVQKLSSLAHITIKNTRSIRGFKAKITRSVHKNNGLRGIVACR